MPSTGNTDDSTRVAWSLACIAIVAFATRMAVASVRPDPAFYTDATFFRLQGRLIALGNGFADPYQYFLHRRVVATAFHPPMLSLVHAGLSVIGLDGIGPARVALALVGVGTVVAIGLLGRDLFGTRVGLMAAALAGLSPNLLAADTTLQSEGLAVLAVTIVLLCTYRLFNRPRTATALLLGAALGVAALTRPESLALAVFVAVPLLRARVVPKRIALTVVALGVTALIVVPWSARGMTAFHRPVPFSTNGLSVVGVANCPLTYSGSLQGDWSPGCPAANRRLYGPTTPRAGDESDVATADAELGRRYLTDHANLFLSRVAWARIGRTWSLYRPFDLRAARSDEQKVRSEMFAGVIVLWASVPLALVGAIRLRRRRASPLLPLIGPPVIVTLVSIVAYGTPRFRVIAEPVVIILGAGGFVATWDYLRTRPTRRTGRAAGGDGPHAASGAHAGVRNVSRAELLALGIRMGN